MEKTEKQLPERKKTFKIEGHSYEVEFPTTGGLMDIEIIKAQLSRGQYNNIADSGTAAGAYSRYLIDMIAVFTILFPDLKKDMNVKSISEIDPLASKKLLNIYIKKVMPWLNEWFELLNADDEEIPE